MSNPIVSSKQWLNGLKITNWIVEKQSSHFYLPLIAKRYAGEEIAKYAKTGLGVALLSPKAKITKC